MNGFWENGLVLSLESDVSIKDVKEFINNEQNVAFQVFFKSSDNKTSFVGVRLNGRSKDEQASIILASFESVRSRGWGSLAKVISGLRLLIDDALFPNCPRLLEVGVVGAWKSVGSVVIWRSDERFPKRDQIRSRLEAHRPIFGPHKNPIGLEFGFNSPLPHWIATQVSKPSEIGHELDLELLSELAQFDK